VSYLTKVLQGFFYRKSLIRGSADGSAENGRPAIGRLNITFRRYEIVRDDSWSTH